MLRLLLLGNYCNTSFRLVGNSVVMIEMSTTATAANDGKFILGPIKRKTNCTTPTRDPSRVEGRL